MLYVMFDKQRGADQTRSPGPPCDTASVPLMEGVALSASLGPLMEVCPCFHMSASTLCHAQPPQRPPRFT